MDNAKIEALSNFDYVIGLIDVTREMIRAMRHHHEVDDRFYYEFIKDLLDIEINLRYGRAQVKFYNNYSDTIYILKLANEEIDNLWSLINLEY